MDTLGFSELDANLRIFVDLVGQWFPVVVGFAAFVGIVSMFAVSFLRARH